MKKLFYFFLAILIILSITCSKNHNKTENPAISSGNFSLDTTEMKTSYAMGYNMGKNFKEIYKNIDQNSVIQGIVDAINQKDPRIPHEQITAILVELQQQVAEQKRKEQGIIAEKNKTEGEQFLKSNLKKSGIFVTQSGLQYEIIKHGTGEKPKVTDQVKVNYRGTLVNGTEFDSSYNRGEPAVFRLNEVIPGWTEALQLMNVGSKYKFFIPSELAYKEHGAGNVIEPNATLIFEIELLEIFPPKSK
jgi:FKBP-type peptidyl-prolyl cis-trans isomerase FklB